MKFPLDANKSKLEPTENILVSYNIVMQALVRHKQPNVVLQASYFQSVFFNKRWTIFSSFGCQERTNKVLHLSFTNKVCSRRENFEIQKFFACWVLKLDALINSGIFGKQYDFILSKNSN